MHNSRIINSVNTKFMINSQDVYFGITRQCAQVGLKTINTFNRKNHLGNHCRKGKEFVYQNLLHNFAQILAQHLVTS
jgi:hypothetical protein